MTIAERVGRYRKLIAVVVGLGVLFVQRRYGVSLSGTENLIVDLVIELSIMGATVVAVERLPNDAAVTPDNPEGS